MALQARVIVCFCLFFHNVHIPSAGVIKHIGKHDEWQYATTTTCDGGVVQKCGPNQWDQVLGDEACAEHGTQSPVDAIFANATLHPEVTMSDISFSTTPETCEFDVAYELNEHTSELAFSKGLNGCELPHITWKGKKYELKQFHYHSPSEHTIDGGYFPMEVHHVHVSEDGDPLVISVMLMIGEPQTSFENTAADFLLNVFKKIPRIPEGNVTNYHELDMVAHSDINPYMTFIPSMTEEFFFYTGSFTTPPCTAGTQWLFAPTPVIVPESTLYMYRAMINANPDNQLATFKDIVGVDTPSWHADAGQFFWDDGHGCNNRPIQPLRGEHRPDRQFYKVIGAENSTDRVVNSARNRRDIFGVAFSFSVAIMFDN